LNNIFSTTKLATKKQIKSTFGNQSKNQRHPINGKKNAQNLFWELEVKKMRKRLSLNQATMNKMH
jgi:hypothetical protein